MTATHKKKLIEVSLPLEAINKGCEEDKNRKTGHIRNLHKWFAPMPLPAWRAMLFAALVDDPSEQDDSGRRAYLFDLIERLSRFDSYKDQGLIAEAQAEIRRNIGDVELTILDPFCGGGSTILEAQRLGLKTRASDLNPLPVLITTTICRIAPLFGNVEPVNSKAEHTPIDGWQQFEGLKQDIRYFANVVRGRAWERLKSFYPSINGSVPTAYRWAWTVVSPDPSAKGRLTPLISDWNLSKHKSLRASISFDPSNADAPFSISKSGTPPKGNTGRSGATCLYTGSPITLAYIRAEGRAGRLVPTLIAIAARDGASTGYFAPQKEQLDAALSAPDIQLSGIEMPEAALGFRVQQYGIKDFLGLFTKRQALALQVFSEEVANISVDIAEAANKSGMRSDGLRLRDGGSGSEAYADAITTVLGLCVGKMAQSNNILVRWFIDPRNGSGKATPSFDRHAVPMVWDFVETNPFGGSVGDWTGPVLETALRAFDLCVPAGVPAQVEQSDARDVGVTINQSTLVATDPPYYANIGYADLSDFFYQWIRPALRSVYPSLLSTLATPKQNELIATPYRHGGDTLQADKYFRSGFADAFRTLGEKSDPRFPILIVYALKQADDKEGGQVSTGWEVFLGGLIDAGLSIVATWPVRTTTNTRMIGIGNNALASAIFVICRKRPTTEVRIGRAQFIRELRETMPDAFRKLQEASIAPVDLAQASIGPGIAVYSRYSEVLETDGSKMSVGTALSLTNQVLDEVQIHQESDFDSDTRWAISWFDQFGFSENDFGLAETLSKAKNVSVSGLVEAGVIASKAGKVRLLKPTELSHDWHPQTDHRLTVWEITHQLIRRLEGEGEGAAASLVRLLGSKADIARELSYRLYTISERRRRSAEGISYNGLVQSWPEITRLARETPETASPTPSQGTLI
jgi:putative DNA methylase